MGTHTISHYKVIKKLGAGGMGEIFLAEDMNLRRKVALKVLSAELTKNEDRLRRFEQEAFAASALSHPNILVIHEIGSDDSVHFIATEFIEGETLRQHMARGRMSLREVLDVAIQAASALAAAHKAGIVHRDIKPENIMLRDDGYVKVLDFGLAKLTEKRAPSTDTEARTVAQVDTNPGTVLGTVNYMSPEQARGRTVDERTDIFSLGVVMYEMAASRAPFEGESSTDVLAAILDREPPPLARYSREAPEALEWIVTKALRKDREERYQTVRELLTDLKGLKQRLEFEAELERSISPETSAITGGRSASVQAAVTSAGHLAVRSGEIEAARTTSSAEYLISEIKHHKTGVLITVLVLVIAAAGIAYFLGSGKAGTLQSIAVLPFVNVNADPNTEYLSDGITESIINSLSRLPNIAVISRSSAFRFKGQQADPQAAGRDLNVQAVLTGRVVQRGDTLSISTELVDVRNNHQLWGEQYNRKLSDIFAVQEEISKEISEKLRVRLGSEEKKQLAKHYTEDTEAYQIYLKGRYYWNKRTEEGLRKSVEYFDQAIEKDPNYALAYAGLADSWFTAGWYRYAVPKEAYTKAKTAAMRALAIDDGLAEAHASLAIVKQTYDLDWSAAESEFKRAIELNPGYANAHHRYSLFLPIMGRMDEAIREAKRAQELDPLSLIINENLGDILYLARRYDEAIEQLKKTLELDPTFRVARGTLAKVYEVKGMYDEMFEQRMKGAPPEVVARRRQIYAASGRKGLLQNTLDSMLEDSKKDYVSAYDIANVYALLDQKDQAFVWYNKALEERSILFTYLIADPRFDNLRSDPRFADLLRRVGLRQ
ncbi:MAG: protein kinase [Acidobacteriota bacterium]